jgi:DNA-binding HxlR family transcriptional regulator
MSPDTPDSDRNLHRFQACSIERAINPLGDRWTFLVLREAFFGVRRFSEMARNLGIARNVLSRRLHQLVEAGIFERVLYNDRGGWHEYRLTEAGKELYDVVLAIMHWSDRHLGGPDGPPLLLHHTACDHDTHGVVVCAHCGEPLCPHEVDPRPGPGAMEQSARTVAEADGAILT